MRYLFLLFVANNLFAATGTTYDVMNVTTLDKSKINFNGQKVTGTALAGATTNIDLTLTDDHLITGASLRAIGACEDDEIKMQVVSGATVVATFIDWYLLGSMDKDLLYPAKIPATLKIRVAYKNTCASASVKVLVNYNLHKVLQ